MRKTKIICTLGPACNDEQTLTELINGGMDAARFNFSHGTHESHLAQLNLLRSACEKAGRGVATILDTKGPEIRIGTFGDGSIELAEGDLFTLTPKDVVGDKTKVSVTYPHLAKEMKVGDRLLIDDGLIDIRVERIAGDDIVCSVATGGPLSNNKSINIPDVNIALPGLTSRDRSDIKFAAENDIDYIAISFVRSAADVNAVRELLRSFGSRDILLISKIENREGVNNLDEIIEASDGIMVARGDLGVEIPMQEIPPLQKEMIHKGVLRGKPVVVATQMLDSMIRNPRPTRAEISDVANAVFDYASCVMLSGETAAGKYPLQALSAMVKTVEEAEKHIDYRRHFLDESAEMTRNITNAISRSCCMTSFDLEADAIITVTHSGATARMISRFKPDCVICATTASEKVCRQLRLSWGVYPTITPSEENTDKLIEGSVESAISAGIVKSGDMVVITAGVPTCITGTTNLIKAMVI